MPFSSSAFRWLLCSSLTAAAGTGMERTATAWLALESGGGAFAVGLVLAARMLPSLLFGLASGTLADRVDRPRQLVTVGAAAMPVMAGLGWLARPGTVDMAYLVPIAFGIGCVSVFDAPARQALVVDTVPREFAPNALALNAAAVRLFMAVGAFAAGVLIPTFGVASCYVGVAAAYGVEVGLVTLVRPRQLHRATLIRSVFRRALWDAARLVVDIPAVRTLMVAGVACEVFAFSYTSATPVFARDVLAAGAEGLGALNAAAAVGGTAAVLLLSAVPSHVRREPVLGAVFLAFGASLVLLASTSSLTAAVGVVVVTGAAAAAFDVLQQTLLQMAVPEEQRGRAVGLWVLGLGSGPFGFLEMGVVVAALGAPSGLLINGSAVVVAAVALLAFAPVYRWIPRRAPAAEAGASLQDKARQE
jgi:MFS family permease